MHNIGDSRTSERLELQSTMEKVKLVLTIRQHAEEGIQVTAWWPNG